MKTTKRAPRDPYRERPCRNCKAQFKPTCKNRKLADEQDFCCANHRKEYWRHGALPFDKLMKRLGVLARKIVREEIGALDSERVREIVREEIETIAAARSAPTMTGCFHG